MNEKLKSVEAQIYMSELTFPFLQERLLHHGELKAWYRYYRGGNQWAKRFHKEENIFLVNQCIIWQQIAEKGEMNIFSLNLEQIAKIQRSYAFDKNTKELVLSEVYATLRTVDKKGRPDLVVFKRPLAEEQGDAAGFEEFVAQLD